MSRWSRTPEAVDAWVIRRAFNDGLYYERSLRGDFTVTDGLFVSVPSGYDFRSKT